VLRDEFFEGDSAVNAGVVLPQQDFFSFLALGQK
jgi:hypothetical protein